MSTLILSDLHLGPGRDPRTGLYSPEEDFFADLALADLLDHYHKQSGTPSPVPPVLSKAEGTGEGRGGGNGDQRAGHVAEPSHHRGDSDGAAHPDPSHHNNHTPAARHSQFAIRNSPFVLILAGDTFNLWEMDPLDELHQIAIGHPIVFDALRRWLNAGNHIHIIPGNHDFQLTFPDVQDTIRNLLTPAHPVTPSPCHLVSFSHFYHDPSLRLYVEHGDRYTNPRKPGRPPNTYRRDYYFISALKSRLPVASVYRAHYVSQVLATDPLAMLPAWRNLPGYLFDPPFELPAHASGENVTLHTINLNIITANWKRVATQARLMHALVTLSILLKLAASALPGTALATYLLTANIPGTLALLAAAILARTLGAAAAYTGQDLAQLDLPRAAAEDIAPAVERAGVRTLIFGHSHIPDLARFGRLAYINTGAWVNVIAPLSAVAPPTRTYAHIDDTGTAHLLQWTDRGPTKPIIFSR